MAIFPGEPGLTSFIQSKDDGSGGDSQITTTNKLTPNFLQAKHPSCRPSNSAKAMRLALRQNQV